MADLGQLVEEEDAAVPQGSAGPLRIVCLILLG
jgi:hypothetical protein